MGQAQAGSGASDRPGFRRQTSEPNGHPSSLPSGLIQYTFRLDSFSKQTNLSYFSCLFERISCKTFTKLGY